MVWTLCRDHLGIGIFYEVKGQLLIEWSANKLANNSHTSSISYIRTYALEHCMNQAWLVPKEASLTCKPYMATLSFATTTFRTSNTQLTLKCSCNPKWVAKLNILMGLWPIRWQSTWMEGIYWCWVVPSAMWAKITSKYILFQACRILLVGWHCLFWEVVSCVAQM